MRFSNFHTHTTFSDGKNTAEEMLLSAIGRGFTALGFSDHSETQCDLSYCMKLADYPTYFATVNALKEKYADRIDVLLGLELDYYSEIIREGLDYTIASVHYICAKGECHPIDHSREQQEHCIRVLCGGDPDEMAKRYYDILVSHVERCRPTFIGHFDVLTKFGIFDNPSDRYLDIATEALDEVLKHCPVIEMNTGAISRKKRDLPYPAEYLLRRILEKGGEITLSADSHAAETLDCFFPESVEILRRVGFDHTVYFDKNGIHRMPI
jgi:histidinol-phosphatase (PHP family)